MGAVLGLLAILLLAAGYFVGSRRGQSRERTLKTTLAERTEQLSAVELELLHRASMDPVSGLHTQQYFQEFLAREWQRASRDRRFVSILMIEIDHFRSFNERQGKSEGDACLRTVAHILKSLIHRPGDLLARYGGAGKFGVVLGGTDIAGGQTLAERLRVAIEEMKKPNPDSANSRFVTISIGAAAVMPDRQAAWQDIELIAAAERALAQAREAGRNVVIVDTPTAPARPA